MVPMRLILARLLVAGCLSVALTALEPASVPAVADPGADPDSCPPICDQIPETAWIHQRALPLGSVYHWPALPGLAVPLTGTVARFRFEDVCNARGVPQDPRDWAVSARVTVSHPDGQWQLQAQVLHWRGDTARGGAIAASVFNTAVAALRGCQLGAPLESPSITTDQPNRMAAVFSGPIVMHTYLVAHVASSTISELTLWSTGPPQVPWPSMADDPVLDSMTSPLCEAYIASCQ
jgi:hypothetical protein